MTNSPKTMLDFYSTSASTSGAAGPATNTSVPAPTAASQVFQNPGPRAWQAIGSVDPLRSTILHTSSPVVPPSPVISTGCAADQRSTELDTMLSPENKYKAVYDSKGARLRIYDSKSKSKMCGHVLTRDVCLVSNPRSAPPLTASRVVQDAKEMALTVQPNMILGVECASEQEPYVILQASTVAYEYQGEDAYTWMGWIRAGDRLIDTIKFERYGDGCSFWSLTEKRFPIYIRGGST